MAACFDSNMRFFEKSDALARAAVGLHCDADVHETDTTATISVQ